MFVENLEVSVTEEFPYEQRLPFLVSWAIHQSDYIQRQRRKAEVTFPPLAPKAMSPSAEVSAGGGPRVHIQVAGPKGGPFQSILKTLLSADNLLVECNPEIPAFPGEEN